MQFIRWKLLPLTGFESEYFSQDAFRLEHYCVSSQVVIRRTEGKKKKIFEK